MMLEVTDEARYCFTFDSSIQVDDQMALKIQLRVIPGTYSLPAESGDFELRLPMCLKVPEPGGRRCR
jgi:hypothetical protein